MDFRSLTSAPTNYNLHLLLPSKNYYYHYSSGLVHYHNSRIIRRRPFHLQLLSKKPSSTAHAASPELDVISTHEHSDGSVIFRFGDPSEVAKSIKVEEEAKSVEDETEGEDKDRYSVIMLDGDQNRAVTIRKPDRVGKRPAPAEVAGEINSINVSSNDSIVVEEKNESGEKLLEDSNDAVSKETVTSFPSVNIENNANMENGTIEAPEASRAMGTSALDKSSGIENSVTTEELQELEISDETSSQSVYSELDTVADLPDGGTADVTSVIDRSPGIKNSVTTEELQEGENADVTSSQSISLVTVADVPDNNLSGATTDITSVIDKSSEIENSVTTKELQEEEIADVTSSQSISLEPGTVADVPDNDLSGATADVTSVLDKSSEIENTVTTEELKEEEITDLVSEQSISLEPGTVADVPDNDLCEATTDVTSVLDKSSGIENSVTTEELHEEEISDVTSEQSTSLKPDIVADVRDNGVLGATTDVSADTEHKKEETELYDDITEDGGQCVKSEMLSQTPQSELDISLSDEIEDENLQNGMQNVITEDTSESEISDAMDVEAKIAINGDDNETEMSDVVVMPPPMVADADAQTSEGGTDKLDEIAKDDSESDTIESMPTPSQLEAEPMLDEETGDVILDESKENDGAESLVTLGEMPEDSILESERTEDDDSVESSDLIEVSEEEVPELEFTKSASNSQDISKTYFVLSSGAALLPHPSKVLTGGEDAYFFSCQKWLGVADGVSQWSLEGNSPGVYAQELMKNCAKLISDSGNTIENPVELLKASVSETHSPGLSTVLIAQLDGEALHVANIGDSGFIVLRHGAVYKRSSPMLHLFNFPLLFESGDDPSPLAELHRIDLEENDVIITATDGLLDNLYDQEISSIVFKSLAADRKPQDIAKLLAKRAQEIGRSPASRSPFADDAQAAGCAGYTGGKLDDVAVIVSVIQKQSDSQTL